MFLNASMIRKPQSADPVRKRNYIRALRARENRPARRNSAVPAMGMTVLFVG
jgi:hypothetical protein